MDTPKWWALVVEVFRHGSKKIEIPCCWPDEQDVSRLLWLILRSLPYEEEQVIRQNFGIGMEEKKSLVEIGKFLNITASEVSSIKKKALHNLHYSRYLSVLLEPWAGVSVLTEKIETERNKELSPFNKAPRARSLTMLAKNSRAKILETSLVDIEFSYRTHNVLVEGGGIKTFAELVQKTEKELLAYRNFGLRSLTEVKNALVLLGLSLEMEITDAAK